MEPVTDNTFRIIIKRWQKRIQRIPTGTLDVIFVGLGFGILFLGAWSKEVQGREEFYMLDGLIMALGFFLMGFTGIVTIVRQEHPLPLFCRLRGTPAVIMGAVGVILGWGLALMFLITAIFP